MVFLKPITYMNINGEKVKRAIEHFKIKMDPSNILVFTDNLCQKVGKFRIVSGTSFAGHNGLKSIFENLEGMKNFMRLGIGIGRPVSHDRDIVVNYVNEKFNKSDLDTLKTKVFP